MNTARSMLLIVKTGSTLPEIAAARGDFEHWFEDAIGHPARVVDVSLGEALPDPRSFRGVVVTGSAAMVSERPPWSERTGRWLARAAAIGPPILAVCYGHQLLADALGGEVGPNPRGREMGTVEVQATAAARLDPLFRDLPSRLVVHATHFESVLRLPEGALPLAGNGADPHQAYRINDHVWSVQFHPELHDEAMRTYVRSRNDLLSNEGLDPTQILESVRSTTHGISLLTRFGRLIGP
ncbi:MAG: glutamine amidotransferase [Myxococcales bacterium]|nr:glutamine amidotransferase [Myxococcales bacterium]